MSKRKIEAKLKRKGIVADRVEYMRGCPTPSGYTNGWDIEISEEIVNLVYDIDDSVDLETDMEFDTISEVFDWIETLPDLSNIDS